MLALAVMFTCVHTYSVVPLVVKECWCMYSQENFGADTAEGKLNLSVLGLMCCWFLGYGYSSEAQPMYSWGALAGFIGLQEAGFY